MKYSGTIRPERTAANPFAKYKGVLKTFRGGKKEINQWIEEMRSDDDGRK